MLKGKTALVTGSTSGIGQGIAEALAAQGANIVLNGFGEAAAIEALRAQIAGKNGVTVTYDGADMSKPAEIARMVADAEAQFGAIDILVNNAGIQFVAPLEEFPGERWDAIIAINLSSAFHSTKAALPAMRKKGWGRVINVASAHGLSASANKSAYVAAKHGVVGLTKVTALETGGSGITCNAICPGWVLTPLVKKQIEDRAAKSGRSYDEEKLDLVAEKTPSKDFSTPEQIGGLAVFLCSPSADQITGAPLSIDGGWMAQ
jgi:3-hydroxybutyrate dehydrogenase